MNGTHEAMLGDTREQVYEVLLEIMPALGRAGIDETRHLKYLGADSVDRVEIIMALINRFSLRVGMSVFSDVPDVGALIGLVASLRRQAA